MSLPFPPLAPHALSFVFGSLNRRLDELWRAPPLSGHGAAVGALCSGRPAVPLSPDLICAIGFAISGRDLNIPLRLRFC